MCELIKQEKKRKYENRVKDPPNKGSVNCQDLSINIIEHKPVQNKQLRHLMELRNCQGGPGGALSNQL